MPCPHCNGQGFTRTVESLGLAIIHLIQEEAAKAEPDQMIQAILPIDVATYLINEKRAQCRHIEQQSAAEILIIPSPRLRSPHYQIKRLKDKISQTASYEIIKQQKPKQTSRKKTSGAKKVMTEPAITEFLTTATQPPPPPTRQKNDGLIKRLWSVILGGDAPEEKPAVVEKPKKTTQSHTRKPRQRRRQNDSRRSTQQQRPRQPRKSSTPKKPAQKSDNNPDKNLVPVPTAILLPKEKEKKEDVTK